jgi:hypothetical protein
MKNIKHLLYLAILILATSCEKEANIPVPEVKQKIVVSCFLAPELNAITVDVSLSDPIFSQESTTEVYDRAHITIAHNGQSTVIPFSYSTSSYYIAQSELPIIAGDTYTINVHVDGFDDATASTTVPQAPPTFTTARVSGFTETQNNGQDHVIALLELRWNDPVSVNNYYRVYSNWVDTIQTPPPNPTYENAEFLSDQFVDDKDKDGQEISLAIQADVYNYNNMGIDFFDIYLVNATREYYLFEKSVNNQGGGDPFSEPTMVFSNITNGYGIFAAYNSQVVRIPR